MLLIPEVRRHLTLERTFDQPLRQLVEKPVLPKDFLWGLTLEQLIQ
jgi:hypothetical protein